MVYIYHGKTETPPVFTLCDSLEKKKELNMWHLSNRSSSSLDAAYLERKILSVLIDGK